MTFLWSGILFAFLAFLWFNLLLFAALLLLPFHGVFVVLDDSVRDSLTGGGARVEPVHSSQQPVTTSTLLIACHVTLHPVTQPWLESGVKAVSHHRMALSTNNKNMIMSFPKAGPQVITTRRFRGTSLPNRTKFGARAKEISRLPTSSHFSVSSLFSRGQTLAMRARDITNTGDLTTVNARMGERSQNYSPTPYLTKEKELRCCRLPLLHLSLHDEINES